MSKKRSRKPRRNAKGISETKAISGDVRIADFADSSVPGLKGTLRKPCSALIEVKKIGNVDDLALIDDALGDEDLDDPKSPKRRSKTKSVGESSEVANDNNSYNHSVNSIHIWLLVADYIPPESVQTFSLICKATWSIVNSASFWIRLYKRYYNRQVLLPKCLSHKFLCNKRLKERVVRALYYLYPPFVRAIKKSYPPLESVVSYVCMNSGFQACEIDKSGNGTSDSWMFYFKFCKSTDGDILKLGHGTNEDNKLLSSRDIGCVLLKVQTDYFCPLQPVVGARLIKVKKSLKHLELSFTTSPVTPGKCLYTNVTTVSLQFSKQPRLLHWWHPDYWDHSRCCK